MSHPFVDPTQMQPEDWQGYLRNAHAALRQNPKDAEALQAIRDANSALGVYDEAEAASPGERIQSGIEGGLKGLSHLPGDVLSVVTHPSQWSHLLRPTQEDVAAIGRGLSSDDPEQVSRTVGDLGAAGLPFAKITPKGSFGLTETATAPGMMQVSSAPVPGPTVGEALPRAVARGVTYPLRVGKALLERPMLTNELLRLRIANEARRGPVTAPESPTVPEPTPPEPTLSSGMPESAARAALAKQGFSPADIERALAGARAPADATAQAPVVPPISQAGVPPRISNPQPIPGSPQGISVVGPPTPPAPTAPTVAEMQPSVAGLGKGKTLPYYPRGGQVEQSMAPPPVQSPLPAGGLPQSPQEIAASLKDQLSLARSLGQEPTPEALTRILQSKGVAPDQIPAVIDALNPSFKGGGFENVASAIQHPAYQRASILANRIVGDPQLVQQYPQFAGQTAEQATATLRKMLVAHAEAGGEMPPLTSLSRFLARLTTGYP